MSTLLLTKGSCLGSEIQSLIHPNPNSHRQVFGLGGALWFLEGKEFEFATTRIVLNR